TTLFRSGAKVSAASARLTTAGQRRREREGRPVGIMLITFLSVAGGCEQPAAQAREPRRARNEPASSPRRDPAQPQAEPRPASGSPGQCGSEFELVAGCRRAAAGWPGGDLLPVPPAGAPR